MKITMKIPAVKTFDLPAGVYRGTLIQCKPLKKQSKKGPVDWVRFIFEINIEELSDQIPCAGRNFLLDLNPGSDLRNFLEVWLGSDFLKAKSNQELDFDTLISKQGDVVLSHYRGDESEKPFVNIDNVFPPNTQQLTQSNLKPKIEPELSDH